jgi:dephospho-CoA kinase
MNKREDRILKVGVTGGIGSGKSTVCTLFSILGIPVFSADNFARELQDNNPDVRKRLIEITGKDLYNSGKLDRTELATIIFSDQTLLTEVNAAIHPAVLSGFEKWILAQKSSYVIMEAAILFESGASKRMDKIITVVAPEEERIKRVMLRSNLSEEQVTERIRNQMDDNKRISMSDYVIHNSENDLIIPAVLKIHSDILTELKIIN